MDEFPSFHASIVELDPEEMIAAIEFGIAATIPNGTDSSLDTIQEEGIDAEGNSYLPSAPHPLFQASIAIVNYFKGEPNKAFSCLQRLFALECLRNEEPDRLAKWIRQEDTSHDFIEMDEVIIAVAATLPVDQQTLRFNADEFFARAEEIAS